MTARANVRFLTLLACAVGLLLAGGAQAATNLAPNPGFELNCGGAPCSWTTGTYTTSTTWSTVNPHAGSASIQLTATEAGYYDFYARSCVTTTTPGTSYVFSAWYRSTVSNLSFVDFTAQYYSAADCTGFISAPAGAYTASPTTTGTWQLITGIAQAPAPPGSNSALLVFGFNCPEPGCPLGGTVNFDDLDMHPQTTAVGFGSATARRTARGVVLRWHTASEANVLGFDVYRQAGERRVRLNAHLIPAGIAVTGQKYSFLDRRAPARRAVRYWIRAVDPHGTTHWYGPVLAPRA